MHAVRERMTTHTNIKYPEVSTCSCGRKNKLHYKDVEIPYKEVKIKILSVPVYLCAKEHLEFARITRVKMNQQLKKAYTSEMTIIHFEG